MSQIALPITFFLNLLLTSLPFLLLGVVISSFLAVFVNSQKLVAFLPRNRVLGAIVGSALGLLLPVGQYGTIPIARRFLLQGVPLAVVFSFLVAAPTLNVVTLWLTWQTFAERSTMLFYRSIWIWVMAVSIGILLSFYREKPSTTAENPLESSLIHSGSFLPPEEESQPLQRVGNLVYEYPSPETPRKFWQSALPLFLEHIIGELAEFSGLLVLGCAIASVAQFFLPQSQLLAGGQTPFLQILVMMLFGFTLSVNASLSAFVPSFPTLLPGSILAYLLFSSLINLQGLGLLIAAFRPKIVLYLTILMALLTVFASLTLSFYLG